MGCPYLKNVNGHAVLMVHEKPFIMLGGEVHNSNSSNADYMGAVWKKADALRMNSVLLPVSWEIIEPKERQFDFTLVDALICQAREHGKKICFLWFGSWKNAQCYYAPEWVKTDVTRFPRAEIVKGVHSVRTRHGITYSTLSAFGEETVKADANAFAHLMAHIRTVDGEENTVICVQVENETGILGEARERSELADKLFGQNVPQALVEYLNGSVLSPELAETFHYAQNASWSQIFGAMAEEAFTAYATASFVERVAAAGKKEYALPMVANSWLDKKQAPGKYPTGGPVKKVIPIWKFAAPSIDIYAPDIYVPNFCDICDTYASEGNPLFIAECATHSYAGVREVYTVGHYHAICYSPFGFEDIGHPFSIMQGMLFGMDTTDEALKTPQSEKEYATITQYLSGMLPLIGSKYGTDCLQAAISETCNETELNFQDFRFQIHFQSKYIHRHNGVFLALENSNNEFYILNCGCIWDIVSMQAERPHAEFLCVEEGFFDDNRWIPTRRLNGDEITVLGSEEPVLLKLKLNAFC